MLTLIALLLLALSAIALATYAYILDQRRRAVLDRALGTTETQVVSRPSVLLVAKKPASEAIGERIRRHFAGYLPTRWLADPAMRERLVRAGYDGEHAAYVYVGARVAALVLLPVAAIVLAIGRPAGDLVLYLLLALVLGSIAPRAVLDHLIRQRQERLRRSVPDALDLLLVCVEAGNSLETAIVRVARELETAHPELASELALVVRRTRAGMPRMDALRGLASRTGVEELRTLVTNVVQSDKWGTSVARVLRVSAETLRRKRRQAAEKKAQLAPVKMTIPLIILILPALFVILLGPSMLTLFGALAGTQQ